jgi:hypothetical protein
MAVIYFPIPVAHEAAQQLLARAGLASPPVPVDSRFPTVAELRGVLADLPGYDADIRTALAPDSSLEAEVCWTAAPDAGPWTVVRMQASVGGVHTPKEFFFSGGWPEAVVAILERLSHTCGPFVLVDDSTVEPLLVTPGLDVQAAIGD